MGDNDISAKDAINYLFGGRKKIPLTDKKFGLKNG